MNAAANCLTTWAQVDTTLWHLAFTGKAKSNRCKYCFSLTHPSDDYDWAPTTSTPMPWTPQRQHSGQKICYIWNDTPGACPVTRYQFEHICVCCAYNPWVQDKFIRGYTVHTAHRTAHRIALSNTDHTSVATAFVARMILLTHSYIGSYLA